MSVLLTAGFSFMYRKGESGKRKTKASFHISHSTFHISHSTFHISHLTFQFGLERYLVAATLQAGRHHSCTGILQIVRELGNIIGLGRRHIYIHL